MAKSKALREILEMSARDKAARSHPSTTLHGWVGTINQRWEFLSIGRDPLKFRRVMVGVAAAALAAVEWMDEREATDGR